MPTDAQVWEALAGVTDPEFPLSIVDLGMVYGVRLEGATAHVKMTFTSIGCPAIDLLVADVHEAVGAVEGIDAVRVTIVWDPPWNKRCVSERGRRVLALYGVAC